LFSKPQSEIELGIDDNGDNNHRPTQFRNQLLILNRLSTNRIQNEEFGLSRPKFGQKLPSMGFPIDGHAGCSKRTSEQKNVCQGTDLFCLGLDAVYKPFLYQNSFISSWLSLWGVGIPTHTLGTTETNKFIFVCFSTYFQVLTFSNCRIDFF
jgi:hypothetical protein